MGRCLPDKYFAIPFDATINFLTIVLRPVGKALRFIFHPVAQLFRGIGRVTKRMFKKKGQEEEEKPVAADDAEKAGIDSVRHQAMPTVFSTEPTKTGPVP